MDAQFHDYDYLTGLYTRQELHNIYQRIAHTSPFHFMLLDIDNFKNVNDVYGHNEGDQLLKAIAVILKECAPKACIFRLGGDEFCLLFIGEYSRTDLCNIAEKIIDRITHKKDFAHISTFISASIGILHNETKCDTINDILQKSDIAMYYAKKHGKSKYIIYDDIEEQIMPQIEMEKRQQQALENGEFEIRYLPTIASQTSKLMLSQIHLFWNMPNGTTAEQDTFLPLFEKNGFIRQLILWVIPEVLSHLKEYHEKTQLTGHIGIRISRLLLLDDEFPNMLDALSTKYGIDPSELDLEIDERFIDRNSTELFYSLSRLKKQGYGISIINVGANFKSIAYWDKIQFNSILFDPGYLQDALNSTRGRQIVKTLLIMGRDLKMKVVADGITTKEDALFLSRCGCNAISGPFYTEPLPLADYYDYIKDKTTQGNGKTEFHFLNDFYSADRKHKGNILGKNITFANGISDNWGSLLFPGGTFAENVLELPAAILAEDSYTICMWLKPLVNTSWTSSIYARFQGGFCAFSPYVIGGNSIFRISEDIDINGFHDAAARQIPKDVWSFVCLTYDDTSEISRTYINTRKAGYRTEVPVFPACRQILLGGDPFQPSFQGYISGLIFYDHVKSENEIIEIYNNFCKEPGFCGAKEDFWLE